MSKRSERTEKVVNMEAERQRRIDAMPAIQRWYFDESKGTAVPEDGAGFVRFDDYVAATDWLLAENARLRMGDTWPEQRRGYEAEIMRLQLHIERGRELLHRVTSTIGEKQNERDIANARLEAINNLLVAYLQGGNEIVVSMDAMKALDDRRYVDFNIEDGMVHIRTKEKEAGHDEAADTGSSLVPASGEEDTAKHAGHDVQPQQDTDIPADR